MTPRERRVAATVVSAIAALGIALFALTAIIFDRHHAELLALVGVRVPPPADPARAMEPLRGNPGQFFTADSYPADAIRNRYQGRVVTSLTVDASGAVVACRVLSSSGHRSLDDRTCEIALNRIVYTPARDRAGRPIPAHATLPVRWVLPE